MKDAAKISHGRRLAITLAAAALHALAASAADLPVPCAPCAAQSFVTAGAASYATSGAVGTISQQSDRAILNWQSFNIAAGNKVVFAQPSANSATLNRIFQADPSRILGSLSANGQIYLINQNGILFGSTAQVNTHALTASTLDMSDQVFNQLGIEEAARQGLPAFAHDPANGAMGAVQVDAGAMLQTDEGGRIMLLAPEVINGGTLRTPGGQSLLAGSQDKVYLTTGYAGTGNLALDTARGITDVRGIVVEVGTGGSVSNLGQILAERGSIGLVGLAVNQSGLVRATTSVNQGGAVWLVARDQAGFVDGGTASGSGELPKRAPIATHSGTLTLGVGSVTEVALDAGSPTALDAQPQPQSQIELTGKTIALQSGARVAAPGGEVLVTATATPDRPGLANQPANDASFSMASGSSIDVAGANTAVLPMSRNLLSVELRGSQLADSPLQQDGPLRNKTIVVDVRKGTPFANIAANLATIERPLDERLATGGSVSVLSEGSVTIPRGATVDFSGGSVSFLPGALETTKLLRSDGQVVDIGSADPNVQYVGLYGAASVPHPKWGVTETFDATGGHVAPIVAGYTEGKDAGSFQLQGRTLNLGGTFRGDIVVDQYQRNATLALAAGAARPYDQVPLRGLVQLGAQGGSSAGLPTGDFALQSLESLNWQGVGRLSIVSNGTISLAADQQVLLPEFGQLSLFAGNAIGLQGVIEVPAGSVSINAAAPGTAKLELGPAARIVTAGNWINDAYDAARALPSGQAIAINGGAVSLQSAGNLTLDAGSLIDTSGGARLSAAGALAGGSGGAISLGVNFQQPGTLTLAGSLRSDALLRGGTLNLTAPGFVLGIDGSGPEHVLLLGPKFFADRGFSGYTFNATHDGIVVPANAVLSLGARNYVLDPTSYGEQPSGRELGSFAGLAVLPDYRRGPVSLTLLNQRALGVSPSQSGIALGPGSLISTDPGAAVTLVSDARILIDGTISAPAGSISVSQIRPVVAANEAGYDPTQALWLGPQAQLLARAVYRPTPSTLTELPTGQLLNAGTVTIAAPRSYIFTDRHSLIDVSGLTQSTAVADGGSFALQPVNADAGSISFQTEGGGVLAGTLRATAGSGAGARGGALSLAFGGGNRGTLTEFVPQFPATARELLIGENLPDVAGPGQAVAVSADGVLAIAPATITAGGFAALSLTTVPTLNRPENGRVAFDGDVALDLPREISISAPVLSSTGGAVALSASHVVLGSAYPAAATPTAGSGSLAVDAGMIDFAGNLSLQGFGGTPASFNSSGDIRFSAGLSGVPVATGDLSRMSGTLRAATDLSFAANQLYPSTLSDFLISAEQPGGVIAVNGAKGSGAPPLSAAGRLVMNADRVLIAGVVRAPFGQIVINAKNAQIEPGAVLSTSGSGVIAPFGVTEFGGADWLYRFNANFGQKIAGAPDKLIAINADTVSVRAGSTIDITGGGDLQALEFVPGPGGTRDILSAAGSGGAFAIMPTLGSAYASYDQAFGGTVLGAGRTVQLNASSGLPAGQYAVLPAAYALLPGAFLVTPQSGGNIAVGTTAAQNSGAVLTTGWYAYAGTSERDSLPTTFLLETGAQVSKRADYLVSTVDAYFGSTAGALLDRDAGQLVLNAGAALNLGGTLTRNSAGGRGSLVDVVADKLSVVGSAGESGSGTIELVAADLNALGADSLSLGAARRRSRNGTTLNVLARTVQLQSDSALNVPELLLAARNQVTIAAGAQIKSSGQVKTDTALALAGDSALLRVSANDQAVITRTASPGASGTVEIDSGARLDGGKSIAVDASFGARLDGDLVTHGGALSVAVPSLSLGAPAAPVSGLLLSESQLTGLDAQQLLLASRGAIDVYGAVNVALKGVVLDAAGLNARENAGQAVSLSADRITLQNSSGASLPVAIGGQGSLDLTAREVDVAAGRFVLAGFAQAGIRTTEQLIGGSKGQNAALVTGGDLAITASRIVASGGSDFSLSAVDGTGQAAGAVALLAPAAPAQLPAVTGLGGRLDVLGSALALSTQLVAPAGQVNLRATGASGIALTGNAAIDVAGRDTAFGSTLLGTVGGRVLLRADSGPVSIGAASVLNASGSSAGADGGRIQIDSAGALDVMPGAHLTASAASGYRGGAALLTAAQLTEGFAALGAQLAQGGVTDQISVRTVSGDLQLAATDRISAREVDLSADGGAITIQGTIDARSAGGGQVNLASRDALLLAPGALIDASATQAGGRGGRVSLATQQGVLTLAAGSAINLAGLEAGGGATDTGVLSLRAPRTIDSVAIDPLQGSIAGTGQIQLEAFRSYAAATLDAGSYAAIAADSEAYMANAPTILAALAASSDPRVRLVAGEEVDSVGDLGVNGPIDLLTVRPGGQAGVLTLRAAGTLSINGTLSDGVASLSAAPDFLPPRDTVATGSSWSYRLVGGADLNSAAPLATRFGAGDLTLASGTLVRTGTGSIDVAAGRDVRLADSSAAIYTFGESRGTGALPVGDLATTPDVIQSLIYGGDFLQHGGDLRLQAGGSIYGADSGQLINDWMARTFGPQGGALSSISLPTSWAINVGAFRQNLGALGGGDITVSAGADINSLSVMLPTTAQPVGGPGTAPAIAGGGNLRVDSGGDLRGGVYYVEHGIAALDVGGQVTSAAAGSALPVLAEGDTQLSIQARKSIGVEAIVNPSLLSVVRSQGAADFVQPVENYFFTYTGASAASLSATSGDVLLRDDESQFQNRAAVELAPNHVVAYHIMPASLSAHALQGSVQFANSFTLFPSTRGNLDIVAANNIGPAPATSSVTQVLSDADPALLPAVTAPTYSFATAVERLGVPGADGLANAKLPDHSGDAVPVRIVARDGNLGVDPTITGSSGRQFTLYLAKLADVRAGQISNLNLKIQHDNPGDISVIASKGNIDFPTQRASDVSVAPNTNLFQIDGPGRLDVIAAGSVNLAASEGIVSRGSRFNTALPAGGAAISVLAGVDPDLDYGPAIDKYLTSAYAVQLDSYLKQIGVPVTGTAVDTFKSLRKELQRPLMLAVYYNELLQAGINATRGVAGAFDRGYAATKTLFGADASRGNLNMFLSRITTLDGGDINILVPHGFVNAGVANTSIIKDQSKLGRLGIVAQGAGSINAMVGDSFLVNQTRVFALDGGDILVWSENKDIDAGGGAKTALTVQRVDTLYNFDGLPTTLQPPTIAGSGIRTAVTTPGRKPGSVYLFAPSGIVNAGDAGIQSAGNITIAAVKVVGADNISAAGTAIGVPVDTGGLGASLSSVSAASSSASSAAEAGDVGGNKNEGAAPLAQEALSWLEVFILGLGEENCRQDDIECLKRQKKQ